MIRTVSMTGTEPGLNPLVTALEEEGFTDVISSHVVESFARHFMVAINSWQESGFGAVAKSYLERLPREQGVRRDIDENGDLLVRYMGNTEAARHKFLPRLGQPAWFDPATRGPRTWKLLRTIQLDTSDTFVFAKAAEPGEWAVPRCICILGQRPRLPWKARCGGRT